MMSTKSVYGILLITSFLFGRQLTVNRTSIAGIAEVRVCHILPVQQNFKVFICTYVCTCVLIWSEADKRSEFSSIGNYFFCPKSLPMI